MIILNLLQKERFTLHSYTEVKPKSKRSSFSEIIASPQLDWDWDPWAMFSLLVLCNSERASEKR